MNFKDIVRIVYDNMPNWNYRREVQKLGNRLI